MTIGAPTCSVCGTVMSLLFTSYFCATCEANPSTLGPWKPTSKPEWIYSIANSEQEIPEEATHAWWIFKNDDVAEEIKFVFGSDPVKIKAWELSRPFKCESSIWDIYKLLVFKKLK